VLLQNANNASVHFLLGQAYAQQKDYPNAEKELKAAVQLDPRLPEAHYYTGLVYLHQSQFEPAAAEFRSELELRPGDLSRDVPSGFHPPVSGPSCPKPSHRYGHAIQLKPDYEAAQFELGRALLQQGDASEAVQHLEIATKLAPDHDAAFLPTKARPTAVPAVSPRQRSTLAHYQRLIEANRLKKRESLEIESLNRVFYIIYATQNSACLPRDEETAYGVWSGR